VFFPQAFSKALFEKQAEFWDSAVVNETRNSVYKRLAKIAAGAGLDESTIYSKLEISDKPDSTGNTNAGNAVTNDLKLLIKVCCLLTHFPPQIRSIHAEGFADMSFFFLLS